MTGVKKCAAITDELSQCRIIQWSFFCWDWYACKESV